MKTRLLLISLLLSSFALAEIKLPRGSFQFSTLAEAKKKATEEKKTIIYIYTEISSNCGLCNGAYEEFMKAVRGKGIIVHLESSEKKDYWAQLPATLQTELALGKFIPKMVVTEADGATVVASINYNTYKADPNSSIRDFKKKLKL